VPKDGDIIRQLKTQSTTVNRQRTSRCRESSLQADVVEYVYVFSHIKAFSTKLHKENDGQT